MSEHSVPVSTYITIFAALLVLTAATYGVATVHLGNPWNDVVAMAIALTKATLVVLFFMHVKYSTRMTTVVVLSAVLFFLFLLGFTMADYLGRGLVLDASGLSVPGK